MMYREPLMSYCSSDDIVEDRYSARKLDGGLAPAAHVLHLQTLLEHVLGYVVQTRRRQRE